VAEALRLLSQSALVHLRKPRSRSAEVGTVHGTKGYDQQVGPVVVVRIHSRWVDGAGDVQVPEGHRYARRVAEGAGLVRDHLVMSILLLRREVEVDMVVSELPAKGMSAVAL
jgi:hypothetical protein